jgi:hypothetical protein
MSFGRGLRDLGGETGIYALEELDRQRNAQLEQAHRVEADPGRQARGGRMLGRVRSLVEKMRPAPK